MVFILFSFQTSVEYEDIIQKQKAEISKEKYSVQQYKHILEAKDMNNMDALTQQLKDTLQKVGTGTEVYVHTHKQVVTGTCMRTSPTQKNYAYLFTNRQQDCDLRYNTKVLFLKIS